MALLSYNQGCQLSSTVRQTAAIKSHLTPSLNTCLSSWQAFVLASSDVNSVILKVGNGSVRAKKKDCGASMCAICGGTAPIMRQVVPVLP